MPATATVLLWDIDGTLLASGGAGRRAMTAAFGELWGRNDACDSFALGGMTDRLIVRTALQAIGVTATVVRMDQVLERYLELLPGSIARATDYHVHRGVVAALDDAARLPRCVIGLGTGNVRQGAQAKLAPVGLHDRFAFGGFGCDAEDRTELLAVGARRGAALLGRAVEDCRIVVIGDTPRDVTAGHAIGAEVLAVATGLVSLDKLQACGPKWAFADLELAGPLGALLGG